MGLAPGCVLAGRYVVAKAITAGGMGAVYEARDSRLADTPCAIKQLLDEDLDDHTASILRRKFAEEMQHLATLNHPGIPRVRDFFTESTNSYLVMDLVDGDTLEKE